MNYIYNKLKIDQYGSEFMSIFNNKSWIELDDIKEFRNKINSLTDPRLNHFKSLNKTHYNERVLLPIKGLDIDYDKLNLKFINSCLSDKYYIILRDLLFTEFEMNFETVVTSTIGYSLDEGVYNLDKDFKFINLNSELIKIKPKSKFIKKNTKNDELIEVSKDVFIDSSNENIILIEGNLIKVITAYGSKLNFPIISNLYNSLHKNMEIVWIPSMDKLSPITECKLLNNKLVKGNYINLSSNKYSIFSATFNILFMPNGKYIYKMYIVIDNKLYKWFSLEEPLQNYIII